MKSNISILIFSLMIVFWGGWGCDRKPAGTLVINDFETDRDLDRIGWHCRTLYELSGEHVSNGHLCLKMTLFPTRYPGVTFKDIPRDWSGYKFLVLDLFCPTNHDSLRMTLRIDDKKKSPAYDDRFNHGLKLQPGMNHIKLPLADAITPSGRPLKLDTIYALILFAASPVEKNEVYVDAVRLVLDE
jgi:hypothetical protein